MVGSSTSSSAQVRPPISLVQKPYASSANRVDCYGRALDSDYDDIDSASGHKATLHTQSLCSPLLQSWPLFTHKTTGTLHEIK